jgi:hypothetical protein
MNRKQSLRHKKIVEQHDLLGIQNFAPGSTGRLRAHPGADQLVDEPATYEVVGSYRECRGDFSAACEQCGKFLRSTVETIFARASGEPFRAYACEPCARSRPLFTK